MPKSKPKFIKQEKHSNTFNVVFLNGQLSKDFWYVESGASFHITVLESQIEDLKQAEMKEVVVANNSKVSVKYMGNINIQARLGKQLHHITVQKVICVPELTTNLLSVSQLIKKGNRVFLK